MDEIKLEPQGADVTEFEGETGGYYSWSTTKSPLLSEAKLGAGKLVLQPRGFALPHYADSAKIGYVLRGICTVGMISPNASQEKVLIIKKGDAIPVPLGAVSWWFNGGDTEMAIIFLGETSKAHIPGQFTYFFLSGGLGILGGFSTKVISTVFNLNEQVSERLPKLQTGILIIKLEETITIPPPSGKEICEKVVSSFDHAMPETEEKHGGKVVSFTEFNFALLGEMGLSANFVKLDAEVTFGPRYTTDGSVQMIYVIRGSGVIQIVGATGKSVLDAKVKEGDLVIVPKFFVAVETADDEGIECFSVVTSSKPIFGQLAGNKSAWNSFSTGVLQAALNVTSEFAEKFKSKIATSTILNSPKSYELD